MKKPSKTPTPPLPPTPLKPSTAKKGTKPKSPTKTPTGTPLKASAKAVSKVVSKVVPTALSEIASEMVEAPAERVAVDSPVKPAPNRPRPFSLRPADPELDSESTRKYEISDAPLPSQPPGAADFENLGELPQGYGSNTLYLVARDPHWLFCYWDLDFVSVKRKTLNADVFLRILAANGSQEQKIKINPNAPNWYIPVPEPGKRYTADLGYHTPAGNWISLCASNPVDVPTTEISTNHAATFATVPLHLSFQHLIDLVHGAMESGESLLGALSRLQREGLLAFGKGQMPDWNSTQRRVLEALLGSEVVEALSLGSGDLDRLLRKSLEEGLNSESASGLSGAALDVPPLQYEESSLSSGFGSSWSGQPLIPESERSFFMHVNAEVIFYGGTHPDATVWIDGKQVRLLPDGSFRCHFIFPDGTNEIPIVARSPDGVEHRSATLTLHRGTTRHGDVGHTPQPKLLKKPIGRKKA